MEVQLPLWIALTAISVSLLVAAYVVSYLQRDSGSHSLAKRVSRLESAAEDLSFQGTQYDLRLKRITSRLAMAQARAKLTETSPEVESDAPQPSDDKPTIRRKLGLVGAGAQRAAFEIHQRGGLTK